MSPHLTGQRDARLSYQHFARLPERRADDTGNAAMGGNQSDGGIGLDRWGNTGAAVRHTPLIIRAAPAHGHPCHHPSGTEGPDGRWWRRPTDHVPEGEMLEWRRHAVTAYPRIRSRGQTCAVEREVLG